ncbi:MAG: precorrin-2 C(20)-methyltransferase [Deferribacteres bacterium]|nr:precorrin-2 C(20)-methyltransferase [Deferribacteres bacterium]
MNKTVYSLGLGPGDHELITVKAKRILEESDIVVVPQSNEQGRSVAREVILHYIDASKIRMCYIPMTNNREELARKYTRLAEEIKGMVEEGKAVAYVTQGDPTIYSTSNYLTERLRAVGVQVRHVPGISSINAAASMLGVPLSIKKGNFGVYEMPSDPAAAADLIQRHPTTVFMKVNNRLPVLIETVKRLKPEEAFLVRRIGLDGEAVYDMLNGAPPPESAYLSVAIIKRRTEYPESSEERR